METLGSSILPADHSPEQLQPTSTTRVIAYASSCATKAAFSEDYARDSLLRAHMQRPSIRDSERSRAPSRIRRADLVARFPDAT